MKRKYRYDKIRLFRIGNLEVWWWKKSYYKDTQQRMEELASQIN